MSDWKSRATPVTADSSSWKDRAKPVDAPVPEEGLMDKLGLTKENGQALLDTVTPDIHTLPDAVDSAVYNAPIIGPATRQVKASIEAAIGQQPSKEAALDSYRKDQEEREKRSPIAAGLGGLAPNALTGGAGLLPQLGISAADTVAKKALSNDQIHAPIDTGNDYLNGVENLATEGLIGGVMHGASKLFSREAYDQLAQKFAKRTFGGTKGQIMKLDVAPGQADTALDKAARTARESGVFDTAIQSKDDVYQQLAAKRQAAGQQVGDIYSTNAKPIAKQDVIDQLTQKAQIAQDAGHGEVADKLMAEAKNMGRISQDELSPEIIKNRKTTLGDQAYGDKLKTDKVAEQAHNTFRDMQEGLVDPDALSSLKDANSKFSDLSTAEKLAKAQAAGEQSSGGGLINTVKGGKIAAGLGAATLALTRNPQAAAAATVAGGFGDALFNKYGNQMAAYGFHQGSQVLKNEQWAKTLSDAAERGGAPGMATAHYLLTQRDPAYRQAHQADQDASKDH